MRRAVGQNYLVIIHARLDASDLVFPDVQIVTLGVVQELLAQLEAADLLDARIVFHVLGQGDLAARHALFHQNGVHRRAHGVYTSRKPGRASAHNDQIIHFQDI
jgi:hypothetical protein